ncbi:MAG: 30S ribosomal protein S4 [Christensenellaceae bacterium]|jgi:small subunit ribosomal protein S4
MARYTGAVCRFCRREGAKLFLKGDRCYSDKCAFTRRPTAPGQHGTSRRKLSEYGIQLREKQKVKRAYGMMEKQFRSYFELARKQRGVTGAYMLSLLERRLDNVVYRMGIGESRAQARQFVMHGHITVNGKKVDIPSFRVSVGDEIAVKEKSAAKDRFKQIAEQGDKPLPKWISFDPVSLRGAIVALPEREDIDLTIEERLIVELYSK